MNKKVIVVLLMIFSVIAYMLNLYFNIIPKTRENFPQNKEKIPPVIMFGEKTYTAKDFNITVIKSQSDYNNNGIDDYTDIVLGAKEDAINKPRYISAYYAGGYPPDNEGVCTDLVWRAFKKAGYSLKDLVDKHIRNNRDLYSHIVTVDSNIDFRRVGNLTIYFRHTAYVLTNDPYQIAEWMPGDIVVFGDNDHIGIISDKRNKDGIPYLIHNLGQPSREEDVLVLSKITGHYRIK